MGLCRGTVTTVARDTPTFGSYFLAYETLERELPRRCPSLGATGTTLVSGGVGGTLSWALSYPIDTIKTHEQTMPRSAPAAERSAFAIARRLVRTRGIGHLYRGIGPCLLRAFPANAVTFLVYRQTLDAIPRALPGTG